MDKRKKTVRNKRKKRRLKSASAGFSALLFMASVFFMLMFVLTAWETSGREGYRRLPAAIENIRERSDGTYAYDINFEKNGKVYTKSIATTKYAPEKKPFVWVSPDNSSIRLTDGSEYQKRKSIYIFASLFMFASAFVMQRK